MSRLKHIIITACTILLVQFAKAQCAVPVSSTEILTNITCRGSGSILVTTLTDGNGVAIDTSHCQYILYNASNTTIVKPQQSSSYIQGLDSGTYTLRIYQVCTSPAGSSSIFTKKIRLTGYYNNLVMGAITTTAPTNPCTANGSITVTGTTKGYGAYEYCLVDSIQAPVLPASYVSPRQSSNIFSGLSAGTYYVRVYDGCNVYSTQKVVLTALVIPAFSGSPSLVRSTCDLVNIRVPVTPASVYGTAQRLWVIYPGGVTDTTYSLAGGRTYVSIQFQYAKITAYPATLQYGYKDLCGNIQTGSMVIYQPRYYIKPNFTAQQYSCTTGYFIPGNVGNSGISLLDSSGNKNNYANAEVFPYDSVSVDSGATWKSYQPGDTLWTPVGTSIKLQYQWCGVAYSTVVSANAPILNPVLYEASKMACDGSKAGIYFFWNNNTYSGNPDSILIQVTAVPPGAPPIPDFYYNKTINSGYMPQLANLDTGTYTLAITDMCSTVSRTIHITNLNGKGVSVPLVKYNVVPCSNYVNLNLNDSTTSPNTSSVSPYFYRRFQVYNSAGTLIKDTFMMRQLTITGTPIILNNLLPDVYTVKSWRYITGLSTDTLCHKTDDVVVSAHLPGSPSLSGSVFANCTNSSLATIVAVPSNGTPPYYYSLYKDAISATNLLAGPQTSNIFTDLAPGVVYVASVSDQCGQGDNVRRSAGPFAPVVVPSTSMMPCAGDKISLSIGYTPGLTYQWIKNGVSILGATDTVYKIAAMSKADSGMYVADVNAGSCLLLSSAALLDMNLCGGGIPLAINLVNFSGSVNAQANAVLNWTVAQPGRGSRFDVLRSVDGNSFTKTGTVYEDGNNNSFSFIDQYYIIAGKVYYKLLMTDADGKQKASNVLMLQNGRLTGSEVSVSPAPFTGFLDIHYTTPQSCTVTITLLDMTGRIVKTQLAAVEAGANSARMQGLDVLPGGIYILRISNEKGEQQMIKVQK